MCMDLLPGETIGSARLWCENLQRSWNRAAVSALATPGWADTMLAPRATIVRPLSRNFIFMVRVLLLDHIRCRTFSSIDASAAVLEGTFRKNDSGHRERRDSPWFACRGLEDVCAGPGEGRPLDVAGLLAGGSSKSAGVAGRTGRGRPAPPGMAQSVGAGPSLHAADLFGADVRAPPGDGVSTM